VRVSLRRPSALALVPVLACLTTQSAGAGVYCNAGETRDGFVALRAAPSAAAPILQRMKPGDEVSPFEDRAGGWRRAEWWRGGVDQRGRSRDRPGDARGFVSESRVDGSCYITPAPRFGATCSVPAAGATLRAQPADEAAAVAAVREGDTLRLAFEKSGVWVRVRWWSDGRFASSAPGSPQLPHAAVGWMHERLIGDSCGFADP
jgi:hypothetical protein